jgi:two-component system chemotaxis response regulator CheY
VPLPNRPILLVDDQFDVQEVTRLVLESEGYRVVTANDGSEALRMLRDGLRPSVIVLDLMMPGMDGIAFRRVQIEDPELAAIPTIIYSASSAGTRVAEETGAAASASKEKLSELLDAIATLSLRENA